MSHNSSPNCSACDKPTAVPDVFFYEWKNREWRLWRCTSCAHQFVFPFVNAQEQEEIFSDAYFSQEGDWACETFEGSYFDCEEQLVREAHEVLDMIPIRSGRLLELGCAGGIFLREARSRGFSVVGIEPNAKMASHAAESFDLEVLGSRLEDVSESRFSAEFDVVVAMDVLEHIPQPNKAIEKISSWMKPEACLVIRGPLSNSRIARLKESARRMLSLVYNVDKRLPGYPLDANCFSKASLTELMTIAGCSSLQWINECEGFANLVGLRKSQS